MDSVVAAFIAGFAIIMFAAVFYVIYDNSCKKFHEFEKNYRKIQDAENLWMNEVEKVLVKCSGTNLYYVKQRRQEYEACKIEMDKCIKQH